MKTVWIASLALLAASSAQAQTTIYKHVDESGRVTYTNRPMKGATVMELEPITLVPGLPAEKVTRAIALAEPKAESAPAPKPLDLRRNVEPAKLEVVNPDAKPIVQPLPASVTSRQALAAVEPSLQRRRDGERRRILEEELKREEESLTGVRGSITQEQLNPQLAAAVRAMQQAENPTPSQLAELRVNIDKASGRIRGLQATAAEHEKNIEALKKELGALKP